MKKYLFIDKIEKGAYSSRCKKSSGQGAVRNCTNSRPAVMRDLLVRELSLTVDSVRIRNRQYSLDVRRNADFL